MQKLELIGPIKLFLIIGVVLAHCGVSSLIEAQGIHDNPWTGIDLFLSQRLFPICVPGFFLISGFLFFRGVENFSASLYFGKIRRRIHTLLIPYLFWNLVCALLLLVKYYCFGMPADGVIVNGRFILWRWLESFWVIPDSYYPCAFAMWFIRNLMVFSLLSPFCWLIIRHWWLSAIFLTAYLIWGNDITHQCQWFVFGALLTRFQMPRISISNSGAIVCLILWPVITYIWQFLPYWGFNLMYIFTLGIFMLLIIHLARIFNRRSTPFKKSLVASLFFVYAFHECFVTICKKFFISFISISTWEGALTVYLLTFVTLYFVSYGVWVILHRVMPRPLSVITGGR